MRVYRTRGGEANRSHQVRILRPIRGGKERHGSLERPFMSSAPTRTDPGTTRTDVGGASPAVPTEFADAVDKAIEAERRGSPRQPLKVEACLIPLGGTDAITCVSDDIGTGGMHVTVPVGYGLAVGQRHELILAMPGASPGTGRVLTGEGHYATVVRTQLRLGQGADQVSVGLRFDQPLVM